MAAIFRDFNGQTDWSWFTSRNPIKRVEDTCGMTAFDDKTEDIMAIVICDNWYEDSVHAHIAVDKLMVVRYGFVKKMFEFIFNNPVKGAKKVCYGFVPDECKRALKVNLKLGFKHNCHLSGGVNGSGFDVLSLVREDCTYLEGNTNGRT